MKKNYDQLFKDYTETGVIEKSRDYSRWTVASLVADPGMHGRQTPVEGDYQSDGALLVTTLASKLAGLLFPASHPFLRIEIADQTKALIEAEAGIDIAALDQDAARIEMEACQRLFLNSSYNQIIRSLLHLIVTGNAAVFRDPDTARTVCYGLNQFALKRDGRGTVVDAIIKEKTYFGSLPEDVQRELIKAKPSKYKKGKEFETEVDLYTRILRSRRSKMMGYSVTQQVDSVELPGAGWYRDKHCPWIFPVWDLVSGENYGRGLVEVHAGAFARLSDISLALTLYQAEALKVVNLVGPESSGDIESLVASDTGDYVRASPETVRAHETGATGKVAATLDMLNDIFGKLARAFMYSGNVRDAERVTAYELRQAAIEADNALGGPYSSLSDGYQLPLAHLLINEVDPDLLMTLEDVQGGYVDISTGINALGRTTEVQNLMSAIQENAALSEMIPFDNRLDPTKVYDRIYASRSIDTSTVFKTDEQLMAEQEAAEERAAAEAQANQAAGMAEQVKMMENLNIG